MKSTLIAVLSAFFCVACGSLDDVEGPEPTENQESSETMNSKADDASSVPCQRSDFTRDGVCDDTCRDADPDCADGALTADELAFLCEMEIDGPNGYCVPACGDLDADCADAGDAEETEPQCAESYDDTDGRCDAECFPSDEDCIALEDTCVDELRYADDQCDTDCAFEDPDCSEDEPDTSILETWQLETCQGLRNFGDLLVDLSYSICVGSRPSEMPACAAACIAAYREAL